MNATSDTATAGDNGTFDPRQAAALLDQTTQRARRELQPHPPWFLATRGVLALIVYGGIWLSVRGQHPYAHPTVAAIPGAIIFGIVNTTATIALARRATAGVTGRSRMHPSEIAVLATIWIGVFAVMGVLAGTGMSDSITYGRYPAAVPLILAGLAWAGMMAARGNRRSAGSALAITAIGVGAWFAGPATAWAVAGVGLCVVLLISAAVVARRQRA
jgi:hypothetical protein